MNTDIAYARMDSPVGPVWVATAGSSVCAVGLGTGQPEHFFAWLARQASAQPPREDAAALDPALTQLREYFSRIRRQFDLSLDVHGTAFQQAVWAELVHIPYGATTTYGEIARRIGRPRAARAVGAAVGANPLSILIPCHRVIGAAGSLTGYGGGLEIKAALLELEGARLR
jgi:methylated-DNA-[protein]-cysteine S-methyltransferase